VWCLTALLLAAAQVNAAPPKALKPMLDEHNKLRAKHCAAPLAWSPVVARSAQRWANTLAAKGCAFEHSRGPYGENLAAGTEGSLGPAEAVGMWYGEVAKYDFRQGRFSMATGHFTQLVWKGTKSLGCGTSKCKGMTIWVCQYDPPGNVEGGYASNVAPTSCRK
jgi:uncharacterized protein YkwD